MSPGGNAVRLIDDKQIDRETAQQLVALLKSLNEQDRVTIVVVTHDLDVANEAKRQIRLKDGKVVGCGTLVRDPHSWSPHVGGIRMVVSLDVRGQGVGRALSQETFALALGSGLERLTVQMTVDQQAAMLGANDLFRISAILYLALIPVIWLARPVRAAPRHCARPLLRARRRKTF